MRRVFACILVIVFAVAFCGCGEKKETNEVLQTHAVADQEYQSSDGTISVTYPQISADKKVLTDVNDLIEQGVKAQLDKLTGADYSNLNLSLEYTLTLDTEALICVLFEGNLYRQGAAHPINIGTSVCVDMNRKEIVDPTTQFTLDEAFVTKFRESLATRPEDHPLSQEQWTAAVQYITEKSDEELLQTLKSEDSVFAISTDGVVVLFPTPHAVGDYLKTTV